jgi:hypothetical protein
VQDVGVDTPTDITIGCLELGSLVPFFVHRPSLKEEGMASISVLHLPLLLGSQLLKT